MKFLFHIFLLLLISACVKSPSHDPTKLIQNQNFPNGLKIDGHEFDSLVIKNCSFSGKALSIGDADYVRIINCSFTDINDNGLKVGFTGPSANCSIENCTFLNIGYNGVDSHENAPNGSILNCTFENVALSETGAGMGQPHHGIYWKGTNVRIEGNTFKAENQKFGNAISVRSSGYIARNIIIGAPKNGIMYFADHPGEDTLLIENNFLTYNKYGIAITTPGNTDYHNEVVIVRFNTVLSSSNYSFYVSNLFEGNMRIEIYGNYAMNDSEEYFKTFYEIDSIYSNLLEKNEPSFYNYQVGDLHLLPGSNAHGYCSGLTKFPSTDIDGDIRVDSTLNAGADE